MNCKTTSSKIDGSLKYFFCYTNVANAGKKHGTLCPIGRSRVNHLEKYVGISGNALKLIKSYFFERTQRVMIDGILSDVASLICGVPQGSVLGLLKFCLYLLHLAAILRYHNIGYHVYADDTQLYISLKNKDPSGPLARLNSYILDIRVWMHDQKQI